MDDIFGIEKLKQSALSNQPGAFKALLNLLKELRHAHHVEYTLIGSFLFEHKTELISLLAAEAIEWFSIDEPSNHYEYLFYHLSHQELQAFEDEFCILLKENGAPEFLNYELLPFFFERGVYDQKVWGNAIDSAIVIAKQRNTAILRRKEQLSISDFITFCSIVLMGISYSLKKDGVTTNEQFREWKILKKDRFDFLLTKALNSYIIALKNLKKELRSNYRKLN